MFGTHQEIGDPLKLQQAGLAPPQSAVALQRCTV
jgi:hypothetical protein